MEGISDANKQLVHDVKEVATNTKREIISKWKKEATVLGNAEEKVDQVVQTIKNPLDNPNKMKQFNNIGELEKATHIKVYRFGYWHHGLYIGDGKVIHFYDGEIIIIPTEDFADNYKIVVVNIHRSYKRETVIDRAMMKHGDRNYNLLFNNCEHFVVWCLKGK